MSATSDRVVAIVGAGMGGLTAAATLAAEGYRVEVFEQAPAFARVGAGIQLGPNAVRVLRRYGVETALCDIACKLGRLANHTWDTDEPLAALEFGDAFEAQWGAPYLFLHRGDLHSILTTMVPASALHLGKQLVDLNPSGDGVELHFGDGTTFRADAVVGADGLHSRVHQIVFGSVHPRFTGRVAYRTVFGSSLLPSPIGGDATKWWGPDRHIVIYNITRGTEVYFVTSVPEADPSQESWSSLGDMDDLRSAFEGFPDKVQMVLKSCPAAHKWGIYVREPLPSWTAGRVVLLGDACHPMTPYMAQGAAMAIEDAAVLSRCLGDSATAFEPAFERYERTRKSRTARVQEMAGTNPVMGETDLSWLYGYDAWTAPLADDATP